MRSGFSTALGALTIVAATAILSGCGILEPTRNTEGGITKPTVMPTVEAWVGDCFSFVENSGLAYVTVLPCADEHTHIVMGRGSFTDRRLELAGGIDAAVGAACEVIYAEFISADEGRGEPEKQSIVARKPPGATETRYSCVAEDAITVEAAG